ncbi:hypothetical protein [Pseudoalteromonas sp. OOF1S-7]|uniref:hypothetical protein n=1 Tax=Pseudoalteromonas sp. OOF1S-7 TaxID=2917757 RepID=UPI001EF662CD|nr:hypothetical protein [Pseudoalteromonas sp. OOF1S-7]MCG7537566.1 hypothetical protein [Pseudoalteromonas sp. OOF1S-7]
MFVYVVFLWCIVLCSFMKYTVRHFYYNNPNQAKICMTSRLSILFVLLNLIAINSTIAMEFKQAYAPIRAGIFTVLIPVERAPDAPIYFSVKPDNTGDKLVWTAVSDAKYYRIEQYTNGRWEMVNANVSGTHYTMPAAASGIYRVTACDDFGCAAAKQQNRVVTEPFSVKALYSNRSQVDDYGRVEVSWQITGAAKVSITKTENGRTVQTWPALNPARGKMSSYVNSMARFNLTAYDFDGQAISRTLSIATLPENPVRLNGVKGEFHQPLFLSGLDVIERSVLEHEDNLFFATHGGRLHRYSVKKKAGKITDWHAKWNIPLDGVMNSAPTIQGDELIFTVSMRNGNGKVCSVRASDGEGQSCSAQKSSNLIASPLIVNRVQPSRLSAVSQFFTESTRAQEGIYVFQRDGLIQVLDPNDLNIVLSEYRVGGIQTEFLNTPALITDGSGERQQFIMQNSENEIFGVDVPVQTVPSAISSTMNQWFSSEQSQTQTRRTINQVQTLPVVWRKKL